MRFYFPLFVFLAISLYSVTSATRVVEWRIELPFTVEELEIGRRYTTIMMSKLETGGGEGVEIVVNEPREGPILGEASGAVFQSQFTHKVLHLSSKVPKTLRYLAPKGSLEVHEKSWNAFPYTRTYLTNHYMKDAFHFDIETQHVTGGADRYNIHNLDTATLERREVIKLDLSRVEPSDDHEETDPTICSMERKSVSLEDGVWVDNNGDSVPVATVYSLQRITFVWWGLQTKMESMIVKAQNRLLTNYYR